jgi:hypothetical protein
MQYLICKNHAMDVLVLVLLDFLNKTDKCFFNCFIPSEAISGITPKDFSNSEL